MLSQEGGEAWGWGGEVHGPRAIAAVEAKPRNTFTR